YLPLFLQVVKGASPTGSGLQLVPLMGGLLVTSIASGQVITRTGHYKPFPIAGTAVMAIGLYLLSTMDAATSTVTSFAFMFVLGLGLGMVMQVLVLAVQNAVDYSDLGVATSGATLFRSIGGSLGTSVLGAIFANRLSVELKSALPSGVALGGETSSIDPQQIEHLPGPVREAYLHAFTNSLSTVFLVAAAIAVVAFALSWLIRELPLRETVAGGDLVDTYAQLRAGDSLGEIENMIGRLNHREGAREIIARVATRAGVELTPAACWLLARLSEDEPPSLQALAEAAGVEPERLLAAGRELLEGELVERVGAAPSAAAVPRPADYRLTDAGRATLARLTETGEQRLSELLEDWRPQEHAELAALIDRLAGEFFIEDSALRSALPTAA
ncbi:MAG TPA: EmrB/QacA family drug resistance transporter, partial [Solirubrobacteraceae bacterium]|nr:EmrB/QacA family drug resistance transporter [Solirubrobacteraceae bacterium]